MTLLKTYGSKIFSASAETLKITSATKAPFEVKDGICELFYSQPSSYVWKISTCTSDKCRSFHFTKRNVSSITIKTRFSQFTIIVKQGNSATQLIGKLKDESDCKNLEGLIYNITNGTPKSESTNDKWLNAKENAKTPITKPRIDVLPLSGRSEQIVSSGKTERTPLGNKPGYQTTSGSGRSAKTKLFQEDVEVMGVKTSDRTPLCNKYQTDSMSSISSKTRLFPSQSEGTGINGTENDVKITAVGGRKPSPFYGNHGSNGHDSKHKIINTYSRTSVPFKPSSSSRSFTFRQRNTDYKIPKLSTRSSSSVVGFSNLGNTCYMNSILQCLLNILNFFQDLNNDENLELVQHNSLYNALCNLGILKYSYETLENQRYALKRVKSAISNAAERFSGYAQHDAHEFLCQCLDQLKDDLSSEVRKRNEARGLDLLQSESKSSICPIKENFESTVMHTITCKACGEQVLKDEACHDFSLVIPEFDENSDPREQSIDKLLHLYFMDEMITYTCEKCKGDSSVLSHQFRKLPRVLILHIKRYDVSDMKKSDRILLPKSIDMNMHVTDQTNPPEKYVYDKEKFKTKEVNFTAYSQISAEKRKSTEPLDNQPLNKSMKNLENLGFDNSFTREGEKDVGYMEGECLARAFRESKRDEQLKLNNSNDFTKLKSATDDASLASKFPAFNTSSTPKITIKEDNIKCDAIKIDLETDNDEFEEGIKDLTSVSDDEEEELKKALELSMKEFEDKQREQYVSYSANHKPEEATHSVSNYEDVGKYTRRTIIPNDEDSENAYKLVGIVNHHGENTGTGHYTSDNFDFKSKKWRSYNDSSVKDIKEHEVRYGRTQSSYIVFYMHVSCYNAILNKSS